MEEKEIINEENKQEQVEESKVAEKENDVNAIPAKWYVLHTFSGYENVAKKNLETVVEKFNLQDRIFDIIIPMEDVVEEKKGKKSEKGRNFV